METLDYSAAGFSTLKALMLKASFPANTIFNFLNLYSVWLFRHNSAFRNALTSLGNSSKTFIDSGVISVFLRSPRLRGPGFTRGLLNDEDLLRGKTHFFLGFDDKELDHICALFTHLQRENVFGHVSSYTRTPRVAFGFREDAAEMDAIAALIRVRPINYLWIGTGNPRQEIMAQELNGRVTVDYIFNVGAAFDFVSEKKKEAPRIFQMLGIEWLFRLATDFRHSRQKVWRSFLGFLYMAGSVRLKETL